MLANSRSAQAHKQRMPFTALRWYRLALNAIPIGATLGESSRGIVAPTPPALAKGVEAAFQLLWQYSSEAVAERREREAATEDTTYHMNFTAL